MGNDPTTSSASASLSSGQLPFGPRFSWRAIVLSPWLYALAAILLVGSLVFLGLLVVVAMTYVGAEDSPQRSFDRGWALFSVLAMMWALVNLFWSNQAAQSGDDSVKPFAVFGHFAIAIGCGLIALGIHFLSLARAMGTEPIVMDYSRSSHQTHDAGPAQAAVVAGNADEGRKVFSTTCITCHGPTGDGLPNLAPSLRGSPFIASADDAAIAGVIRLGRAVTDPSNKTKKVMPARGGNPFLGDDKIAHLVAFVKAIQSEAPAMTGSVDPNAPPPAQLSKWVLPTATAAPIGIISLRGSDDIGDDDSLKFRDQIRKSGLVATLTLALTGIHGLFLVGVMVASSNVLIRGMTRESTAIDESWWTWSTLGWCAAAIVWFVVFLFGFVML